MSKLLFMLLQFAFASGTSSADFLAAFEGIHQVGNCRLEVRMSKVEGLYADVLIEHPQKGTYYIPIYKGSFESVRMSWQTEILDHKFLYKYRDHVWDERNGSWEAYEVMIKQNPKNEKDMLFRFSVFTSKIAQRDGFAYKTMFCETEWVN